MSELQCPATVLFARHAEAAAEPAESGSDRGDVGGSLTEAGRGQAAALARALHGRAVSHVWTSSMTPAVQTAEIAAAALGVGVTARDELRGFDVDLGTRVPGGESGAELRQRFSLVLEEIVDQHRGETVLVVSHGGLLRLCVPLLFRAIGGVHPTQLANCQLVETSFADDPVIVSWPSSASD